MPCRALDAFGRPGAADRPVLAEPGLNALSGIGCIRTEVAEIINLQDVRLNALSGIGCIRT